MNTETRIDDLIHRWEEMRERGTSVPIEALCSDCPELTEEVRRRIRALREVDSALDIAVQDLRPTPEDRVREGAELARGLPEVVRATAVYRPERHHDHGGLGVIFAAHQEELDRTVALKRIRPDRLHAAARRRFLREAAITARLQHPGIVPIYGVGEDDGGPFYIMPFIEGQTLQQAIERFHGDDSLRRDAGRRSLRLRELLQHFVAACNTVAYAHDQGVVHRDLKPSNIMLGPYSETLVMDWGLARRLVGDEAADAEGDAPSPSPSSEGVTVTGEVLGTPQYMSPEQARGEPAGPAGDIFCLGLNLYAILTGESAFEESSFRDADRLKAVREAAIVPPRARDAKLPRGLEAICLKALAARPEDRYASARALTEDVTRWLGDEPVTAWREPFSRRARRWARRNRTVVTGAVAALLAGMIGLAAVAVVQAGSNARLKTAYDATNRALTEKTVAQKATEEALADTRAAKKATDAALAQSEESRKQAEAVIRFLVEAFRSPDPSQDGRQVKVVDVLDRASERLDREFAGSKATKAALLDALGRTYYGLGLSDRAATLLTKGRAEHEAAQGPDHPQTLTTRSDLASAYRQAGRTSEAIELDEATLRLREARLGPDHRDTLISRHNLATSYRQAGRTSEAIGLLESSHKLLKAKLGPDHHDTLASGTNLAAAYSDAGRLPDAIRLDESTLKLCEAKLGPHHPLTLMSRHNLATYYVNAGRTAEGISLFEAMLKQSEARLGPDHASTILNRINLAGAYHNAGRLADAIPLLKAGFELSEAKLGPHHPLTLRSRSFLATSYLDAGRTAEAIPLFEATLKLCEAKLGPDHPDTLIIRSDLAIAYRQAGRISVAMGLDEATLKLREAKLGPDHPGTLTSRSNLAADYREVGRTSEAIRLFELTLKLREAKLGPDHPETLRNRTNLAVAYADAGRTAEAIPLFEATIKHCEAKQGPTHPDTLNSYGNLATAYQSLGQWAEAEGVYRDVLARRRRAVGPDSPLLAGDLAALGRYLVQQSRWAEAEPLLREAVAICAKATPDDWTRYDAMSLLGRALLGEGRYAEAEPPVIAGYEGLKARESRIGVPDRSRLREAAERVVRLYEGSGQPEKAATWKAKLGMPDLPAEVFARP